jgi:hypothetical protein
MQPYTRIHQRVEKKKCKPKYFFTFVRWLVVSLILLFVIIEVAIYFIHLIVLHLIVVVR